jgi:hypothetical protein
VTLPAPQLQVGHKNLGNGDQVSPCGVNLDSSNFVPDEYIVSLEGKQPHFLGSPYDLKANVAGLQSERSIDEFSIRQFSVFAGFEREFLPGLRGGLMHEFEDSDIYDVAPDAVLTPARRTTGMVTSTRSSSTTPRRRLRTEASAFESPPPLRPASIRVAGPLLQ